MTEGKMKLALARFKVGDGLDNKELNALIELFERVNNDLRKLTHQFDAGFGLAHKEVLSNLQQLKSFKLARDGR